MSPANEQSPSVGRIVHVNDVVGRCQAAIVADTQGDIINVMVIRHSGTPGSMTTVPFSAAPYDRAKPQVNWHWPERV